MKYLNPHVEWDMVFERLGKSLGIRMPVEISEHTESASETGLPNFACQCFQPIGIISL
jgi:hypothetical protein